MEVINWLVQPNIAYATSTLQDPWPAGFQTDIFSGMTDLMVIFTTPVGTILTILGICLVIAVLIKAVTR